MTKFAVINVGEKQYQVKEGDLIDIEKIPGKLEEKISIDDVLLVSDGEKIFIGKPKLEKFKVTAKIIGQYKEAKIYIQKFRAKSRYRRKTGHRQQKTKIKILKIVAS